MKLWAGPSGLQRLIHLAGDVPVEIMVSPASAKNFRGDMESLILLEENFTTFLNGSLQNSLEKSKHNDQFTSNTMQFYLAQCPITSMDPASGHLRPGPLSALQPDFDIPFPILKNLIPTSNSTTSIDKDNSNISQINFWANMHSPVTSSLHYDPYQNLLCVVTGQKIVRLLPPSATKHLHNVALVYHDSCNHADDDLFNPSRKEELLSNDSSHLQLLEFILNPGDSLFLPEGWWHQVSSSAGTLAVNFWWESSIISPNLESLSSQKFTIENNNIMKNYYLRRRAQILTEQKKHEMLDEACAHAWKLNPIEFQQYYDDNCILRYEYNDLDTPLTPAEDEYLIKVNTLLTAQPRASIELIETHVLALLHSGALPFMRILLGLKKECSGVITVLLTEVDSPKIWEALTTGLERRVSLEAAEMSGGCSAGDWVGKAGGVERVLANFYDDLYSDRGCDRSVITARMMKFKKEFAKQAFDSVVFPSEGEEEELNSCPDKKRSRKI